MAADVSISAATLEHAAELAARLRAADQAEVEAATGREPLEVIADGLRQSAEAWSVFFGAELAFMWGVVDLGAIGWRCGLGWLLGTDTVQRRAKTFWRACRVLMPLAMKEWDSLTNAIDCRHAQSLRWGKRLGFRLDAPAPLGPAGLPFQIFHVTREDVACALRQ